MQAIMDKPIIMVVDDNQAFLDLFSLAAPEEFDVLPVDSARAAMDRLGKEPVDLVITDIMLADIKGTDLFFQIQDLYPDIPVILITAFGNTEGAIQAVKQGAFHYFEKPITDKLDLFWSTVREALKKRAMHREISTLRRGHTFREQTGIRLLGRSAAMQQIRSAIGEIADLPVTVLITGETGTGKELVAQAIHQQSSRRDQAFFAVNCGALAPELLENELFGHERGAFTGAMERKQGIFEVVHKGTLLLDELSESPAAFQAKLLRVLETRSFSRVGGTAVLTSDFRTIAATNRNLKEEIAAGRFREDLFYRLNTYTIVVPPLRDRREDIAPIAEYYRQEFAKAYRLPVERISESALATLRIYDWPGNVRELRNVIERAVITCRGPIITTDNLPFNETVPRMESDLNLKQIERFYIERALERTGGNKSRAAGMLGISRKTLIDKVKRYG